SSTRGYFTRGLWSRMQAALRRFIPRIPSSRRRRAAVNSQNIGRLLSQVVGRSLGQAVNDEVQLRPRRPRRGREESAEPEQLRQTITGVAADQELYRHDHS